MGNAPLQARDHDERTDRVYLEAALNPTYGSYTLLMEHAWNARYRHGYRIPHADMVELLDTDLAAIRRAVDAALRIAPR